MSIPANSEDVKRRKYDSPRRRAQAASTRRDIIDAARRLFEGSGYAATTLAAIATEAEVAVETIYRSFDGKAGLLEEVIQAAVAGGADRAQLPVTERPAISAVIEEPDARKKVALHSATQPGIHARSGPLLRALREAAAADEDLRKTYERLEQQRLNGMSQYAQDLIGTGQARHDLSQ
ncbi:MAG TPA: TetR family transcriptional regulator, partial [Acidimicrobiia bacterium]|nr:TetR family transcriptional regulator [Acidimicrobiia bacterium]